MFDRVKSLLKGWWNRMFPITTVQAALGCKVSLSSDMVEKIEEWSAMLSGNASWCKDYITSLRIEEGICREFADIVLNEMESSVSDDALDIIYKKAIKDLNESLQQGLALGSFVIKPLLDGNTEVITAERIIPILFDADNKPTDIAFIQMKKISSDKYYFRFERHTLTDIGLKISNRAFTSSSPGVIGREVSLTDMEEWKDILPEVTYPGMLDMDFGYYRNPLINKVDGSACGTSIYESAINLIKKADTQGAGLEWEFESGERAVHVDASALRSPDKNGKSGVAKLNKRLYRGLDISMGKDEELFKEYSPEFRDESIIRGLEKYYRQIEFVVGLAYGDLSNVNEVEKTAAEIKTSKSRKYNRVKAIQTNLQDCLADLVKAIAFYNSMYTKKYEFTCTFNDSILTDEETEREQDRKDVAIGAMPLYEYRMKWYGEEEAVAKTKVVEEQPAME